MKKYIIKVKLPNLDEVHAKVVAQNETSAINRIVDSEEFKKFIGATPLSEIKFYCDGEEEIKPVQLEDCHLTTFEGVGCAVEHLASGAIVGFEEGRFNDTAQVLTYPYALTPEQIAQVLREVGEWLYIFHRRKVMNLREITAAFLRSRRMTMKDLALEIGADHRAFTYYLAGKRPLPYEQIENLLVVLKQAGEL